MPRRRGVPEMAKISLRLAVRYAVNELCADPEKTFSRLQEDKIELVVKIYSFLGQFSNTVTVFCTFSRYLQYNVQFSAIYLALGYHWTLKIRSANIS